MNLAKLAIARMMAGMRTPEYRATEKELTEQRADLHEEMQGILDTAKAEKRAMTEEEQTRFNEIEIKIKAIDATLEAEARAKGIKEKTITVSEDETKEQLEERAFANYIRGIVEQRADVNLTTGENGAVIPTSIANKIIKKVYGFVASLPSGYFPQIHSGKFVEMPYEVIFQKKSLVNSLSCSSVKLPLCKSLM